MAIKGNPTESGRLADGHKRWPSSGERVASGRSVARVSKANFFVKPNEQRQACLTFVMARKNLPQWTACDAHSEVAFGVGHKRSPWLFILRFAKWPSVAYFLVKQKVGTTRLHEMQLTRKRREKKNGNITKSKKKRTRCHVNGIAQAKWSLMKKETALPTL